MTQLRPSIATGAELTQETFADFIARLRHDVDGDGVDEHCTADALFVVQARQIITGIDTDYTDQLCVCCEDSMWFTPQEYWDDCGEEEREELNRLASDGEEADILFLELGTADQWEILGEREDHTVTGWDDRWDYVNAHFTQAAAEAFIQRKKHDYRHGLRVYVESQYYCWEFNAIVKALLRGELTFKPKEGGEA
ncbi:hypothetical protein FYK34_07740 [Chromobacterium paludis]|uniref:Uncharacterized protein n=2 Tax=Chromobacterium paludis TaxID=2605945 RepID=A0A5C1DMY6_9NEIS|nr:hypothetical protein FYK34_07740 [Chromobacterium paludis]